jgi:hypothetical protein
MSKITSFFIFVILVMQGLFLYFLVNPINVASQLSSVQKINKITTLTQTPLPINELPQIGVVGDKTTLGDIETIKSTNKIDGEVYANAANGDYVLGYSNAGRLVIFRPSEDKIIYDGDSSTKKLQSGQQALVSNVVKSTAAANLIPADYKQVPQISVVTSAEDLKKGNDFYKDVVKDDLVATFTAPNLVVIYRPTTQQIVKSGQFQISLK